MEEFQGGAKRKVHSLITKLLLRLGLDQALIQTSHVDALAVAIPEILNNASHPQLNSASPATTPTTLSWWEEDEDSTTGRTVREIVLRGFYILKAYAIDSQDIADSDFKLLLRFLYESAPVTSQAHLKMQDYITLLDIFPVFSIGGGGADAGIGSASGVDSDDIMSMTLKLHIIEQYKQRIESVIAATQSKYTTEDIESAKQNLEVAISYISDVSKEILSQASRSFEGGGGVVTGNANLFLSPASQALLAKGEFDQAFIMISNERKGLEKKMSVYGVSEGEQDLESFLRNLAIQQVDGETVSQRMHEALEASVEAFEKEAMNKHKQNAAPAIDVVANLTALNSKLATCRADFDSSMTELVRSTSREIDNRLRDFIGELHENATSLARERELQTSMWLQNIRERRLASQSRFQEKFEQHLQTMTEEAKAMCRRYVDVEEKAKLILQHSSMEAKDREDSAIHDHDYKHHDTHYKIMTRPKVLKRVLINSYLTSVHEQEAANNSEFAGFINHQYFAKNVEEFKREHSKVALQSSAAFDHMTTEAHAQFALRNLQRQVEEIS